MIVREYATTDYVDAHNTSELAHDDIRTSINDLNTLVGDVPVSQQINDSIGTLREEIGQIEDITEAEILALFN